jgi:hypothetical protein
MRNIFERKYCLMVAIACTASLATFLTAPGQSHIHSGEDLFIRAEFGGNGRTCVTCHSLRTQALSALRTHSQITEQPSGDELERRPYQLSPAQHIVDVLLIRSRRILMTSS